MIKNITIKNFKSIEDLSFDLGRINVIIGANGSGKTNILEAIAIGAAASADKLDYEFLSNRIRISNPEFMYNAFPRKKNKLIEINFKTHNNSFEYHLTNLDDRSWIDKNKYKIQQELDILFKDLFKGSDKQELHDFLKENKSFSSNTIKHHIKEKKIYKDSLLEIKKFVENNFPCKEISNFLIYSPEYSSLKKFEEPGQIIPLGSKGEGLFYTIKQIFKTKKDSKQKRAIKNHLHLLDWFEDFYIPNDLMTNENKIAILDKYLNPELRYFDQRSANEGFLYLLFYLVLFTDKATPEFFAIDNIETSFNPKLCRNLMTVFSLLTKQFDKQVILTTHNPAVLDGIDLKDNNQRLFVAYRKKDGGTGLERITHKESTRKKLSELWMSGIIGGLPDNF